jgi:hypothetical protein
MHRRYSGGNIRTLGLGILPVISVLGAGLNLSDTSANTIFHGIEHRNPSFEKIYVEKIEIYDPIPALPGQGSKIPAVLLGVLSLCSSFQLSRNRMAKKQKTDGRTDGQRNDFNRAHFLKTSSENRISKKI